MTNIIDQHHRNAALDPHHSICVTAPAGSGKTELLTQRMLTLLARVEQPEAILAITFTRKAAAEMRVRIIEALQSAYSDDASVIEPHKQLRWRLAKKVLTADQTHGWQLLDNPNRLNIQTIDSFCSSLTRQLPILSGFGAQPAITQHPKPYYRAAVQALLARLATGQADLMTLLSHLDNDLGIAERLLVELLAQREQWLIHSRIEGYDSRVRALIEQTARHIISDTLTTVAAELAPLAPTLLPLLDYAGQHVPGGHCAQRLVGLVELPGTHYSDVEHWLPIAELLLTTQHQWRRQVDKRQGFPTVTQHGDKKQAKIYKQQITQLLAELAHNKMLLAALAALRHLPPAQFDDNYWQIMVALSRLLPLLLAELQIVFQQHGEVDYSEMTIAALAALGTDEAPTDMTLKLDYRLQHILLDECQDTSSTQFTLLERLVSHWPEHNAITDDNPHTLFIVGDGMQSIYGFRAANVGLFINARRHGVNGLQLKDLPLMVNFRSCPAVVAWINAHFAAAFPEQADSARGAVAYEYATAFQPHDDNSGVTVQGFCGATAAQQEAAQVVQRVRDALAGDADGSIAILVRSRLHLQAIIPALRAAKIAWRATDIDPLISYSYVGDLLTLTKAWLNHHDRIAWAALLRSPLVGLDNHDLFYLLGDHYATVWSALQDSKRRQSLSAHGQQRLATVCTLLAATWQNRQRLALRSVVESLWLQLGGASLLADEEQLAHVSDFFDHLEVYCNGQHTDNLVEFERQLNTLYTSRSIADKSATAAAAVVDIMTIHKAKGLEFATVILPGLARAAATSTRSLLMWREYTAADGSDGLLISPITATIERDNALYDHLRYEHQQRLLLENTRLLYVAVPRAICRLHLLFTASDEQRPPPQNSLIFPLWPTLQQTVDWSLNDADKQVEEQQDQQHTAQDQYLTRIDSSWQPPELIVDNPLSGYYFDLPIDDGTLNHPPPLDTETLLPRCVGTVIHWLLEQFANVGTDCWRQQSDTQRTAWLHSLLRHSGLPAAQWAIARPMIEQAIDNTLADKRGQWLLSSKHRYARAELALLAQSSNDLRAHTKVIDRLLVDDNNVCWIVDYKTGHPQVGEKRDDFIARESAAYGQQLADYRHYVQHYLVALDDSEQWRRAVKARDNIKTALYFTYYPHWEEVSW